MKEENYKAVSWGFIYVLSLSLKNCVLWDLHFCQEKKKKKLPLKIWEIEL